MSGTGPAFAERVLAWQLRAGRHHLPWQGSRDPYRVWLSEIMLQQTQVSTVLAYYERFLARFPDVAALAAAPLDEVLGLWSGLGYYSRARNLHRCAQAVVTRFGGQFPRLAAELQTLPGIGRSTAAAIAAFCHGERVAILDGNVRRVLSRVLGFDADLAQAASVRTLWDRATALLPVDDPLQSMPRYTQGLMDLGATVCLPRRPLCHACPAVDLCAAAASGAPERFPVRTRTLRRSAHSLWLMLARDGEGRVWLERRAARGIWAGLHCVPVYESRDALRQAWPSLAEDALRDAPAFVHVLTHRDLHLHPVHAHGLAPQAAPGDGDWFSPAQWGPLGLPAPVRRLLEASLGPDRPAT